VRRVLVTGTSGFIGRHLADFLYAKGYSVLGLDRRPLTNYGHGWRDAICDLLDESSLREEFRRFSPEIVLHLAARTDLDETREISGYSSNIQGVVNLIGAIRETPTVQRALCTSSQLVCRIGYVPSGDEDYCPSTLYGESKVETEKIWRQSEGGGVEWAIVRPTTIWGPYMNPHYLRFFTMIRDGRYFHVSGGPRRKSYGFVGNAVRQYEALVRASTHQFVGRVFYIADYEPIAIEEWADAFGEEFGAPTIRTMPVWLMRVAAMCGDVVNALGFRDFPFNSFRLGNVVTEYQIDMSVTRAVCGEVPYSMRQGVAETAAWVRSVWSQGY
jgi:nucleoside-diphosphate-sugar epimerase